MNDAAEKKNGDSAGLDGRSCRILNALVSLYQDDPGLVLTIARLAADEAAFAEALSALRSEAEATDGSPAASISDEEWKSFRLAVKGRKRLAELFALGGLSANDAQKLGTLAQLADLTPDGSEALNTQDGVFMNVLTVVPDRTTTATSDASKVAARLIEADIVKFLTLRDANEKLTAELNDLARKPYWHTVLASLEDSADYMDSLEDKTEGEAVSPRVAARQALQSLKQQSHSNRYALDTTFRLSRVSRRLFRLLYDSPAVIEQARKELTVTAPPDVDDLMLDANTPPQPKQEGNLVEQREKLAEKVLERLREDTQTKAKLERIEADVKLRFRVARHYLSLREFAKLDAFFNKWPDAARIATSSHDGYEGLLKAETHYLNPGATPPTLVTNDDKRLEDMCANDEMLQRFLRLHPYFSEIDQKKLLQRRLTLPLDAAEPQTATAGGTVTATGATAEPQPESATKSAPTTTTPPAETLDIIITISRSGEQDAEAAEAEPPQGLIYRVSAETRPPTEQVEDVARLELPEQADLLRPFNLKPDAAALSKSLSRTDADSTQQIARAGQVLFEKVLGRLSKQPNFAALDGELRGSRAVRLFVNTDAPEVLNLPWEWLALPGQKESVALLPNRSLVRHITPSESDTPPMLRTDLLPLRVFTLLGQNVRQEEAMSRLDGLRSVFDRGEAVRLKPPKLEDVLQSQEELGRELKGFRPHLLHVEATVYFEPEGRRSVLLQVQKANPFLEFSTLSDMLLEAGVQLLVFGNSTFYDRVGNQPSELDLVVKLMREGLPAAVVPTRPVEPRSATEFLRGFYRAWLNGKTLEEAVNTARGEMRSRGGDWSAYALFGDTAAIEGLRLPRAPS